MKEISLSHCDGSNNVQTKCNSLLVTSLYRIVFHRINNVFLETWLVPSADKLIHVIVFFNN